jgi:hypothetical protein
VTEEVLNLQDYGATSTPSRSFSRATFKGRRHRASGGECRRPAEEWDTGHPHRYRIPLRDVNTLEPVGRNVVVDNTWTAIAAVVETTINDVIMLPGDFRNTFRATGKTRDAAVAGTVPMGSGRISWYTRWNSTHRPASSLGSEAGPAVAGQSGARKQGCSRGGQGCVNAPVAVGWPPDGLSHHQSAEINVSVETAVRGDGGASSSSAREITRQGWTSAALPLTSA